MLDLALFEEAADTAQPEIQSDVPKTALSEDKPAPAPTASSDEFYQKLREMKTRQHQSEGELVRLMAERFGVAKNDYEAIKTAINEDMAKGKSDDVSEKLKAWQEREAKVKEVYPDFELARELSNRDFFNLCYNGVDVMTAYQVLHFDEVIMAAMRYAVSEMKRADTKSNAYGTGRVREGALDDSSRRMRQEKPKLTKKERTELIRRAERGETVRL
ncbi:MAG: hypothetical protein IKT78_04385 [Ruminiclostridium sp.]|nr:hypothetical protein [Ruminiclostridium sp.]